jgi:Flp pilus assembly CpaF family ATPase
MFYRLSLIFAFILIQGCTATPVKTTLLETVSESSDNTVRVICHREKKLGSHLTAIVCRDIDGLAAEGELTRDVMQRAQLRTPSLKQM